MALPTTDMRYKLCWEVSITPAHQHILKDAQKVLYLLARASSSGLKALVWARNSAERSFEKFFCDFVMAPRWLSYQRSTSRSGAARSIFKGKKSTWLQLAARSRPTPRNMVVRWEEWSRKNSFGKQQRRTGSGRIEPPERRARSRDVVCWTKSSSEKSFGKTAGVNRTAIFTKNY